MRSKGHTPSAKAKRWMVWVGECPCVNCSHWPVHVHHCAGATAKHNKVAIGDWWLLPLCYECHQGRHGVHGDRARFWRLSRNRKTVEHHLFIALMSVARGAPGSPVQPPDAVVRAIEEYHL